jgi:pimeloyl-ACP methyl ester carboxylesterase
MSRAEPFDIENRPVQVGAGPIRLHGTVQWPGRRESRPPRCRDGGPRPTVVVCHGFKGFMEWGFFPPLADLLVERGFTVIRFNFSGNGMRPGDDLVTDLEAFRGSTFSQDLADLLRILAAAGTEIAPDHVDPDHLALLGHSRGGGAALLAAAHPDWRDRLRALVTWSAVSTFDRFGEEAKEIWRRGEDVPIANARTGQELPLGRETLDDVECHREELDLHAAAGRRSAPWLIVHGGDDETVPSAEAESLEGAAAGLCELRLVAGASHTFGAQHPFAGPTPQLIEAMNATQTWLRRHLCG